MQSIRKFLLFYKAWRDRRIKFSVFKTEMLCINKMHETAACKQKLILNATS